MYAYKINAYMLRMCVCVCVSNLYIIETGATGENDTDFSISTSHAQVVYFLCRKKRSYKPCHVERSVVGTKKSFILTACSWSLHIK